MPRSGRGTLINNSLAALTIGTLQIGVAISLSALIFDGRLAPAAGRLAAAAVLGTAIVSAFIGLRSRMPVVTAGAQDTAAVVLAAVAASIAATPLLTDAEAIATAIVMLALTALATAVSFWLVARAGLGNAIRFLPSSVIAGFTAGTGWLLFRGGIEVSAGRPIELASIGELVSGTSARSLALALVVAAVMVIVSVRGWPASLISLFVLVSVAAFHLAVALVGSLDRVEADGWLIGPFSDDLSRSLIAPTDLREADWATLADQALPMIAVVAVSIVGLLLNLGGLEAIVGDDVDIRHETQVAGVSNLGVAAAGGIIGYHLIGDTTLAQQLGARGRQVPLLIAGLASAVFVAGPDLIALVPRFVAGGLLAGVGANLLVRWLLATLPQLTRADRVISSLILASIAILGVLNGVAIGVAVAAAVFVIAYSRTSPVRFELRGSGSSNVDRDPAAHELLQSERDAISVVALQGYLFFGSIRAIRRRIAELPGTATGDTRPHWLIIDFNRVTGLDGTAAAGIITALDALGDHVQPILCSMSEEVAATLQPGRRRTAPDLDHAFEMAETELLAAAGRLTALSDQAVGRLASHMTRRTLQPGEVLIRAGDDDRSVYVLEQGTLTAATSLDDERSHRLRRVTAGAVVGEIGFILGGQRTATVTADGVAIVRVLARDEFDLLAASDPALALELAELLNDVLASRLKVTSGVVRNLLR